MQQPPAALDRGVVMFGFKRSIRILDVLVQLGRSAGPIAALLAWSVPVDAADWSVTSQGDVRADDNLFRKPGGERQSDRIYSVGVGGLIGFDARGATGDVEGELNQSWFAKNTYLNNLGYNVVARVSRPTGRLTFDVDASRQRRLSDFSEIYSSTRNMQTFTQADGQVRLAIAGDLRAIVGGSLMRDQNSSVSGLGYNTSGASAGLGYYSPTGNYVAILFQQATSRGVGGGQPIELGGQTQIYRQRYDENRISAAIHYQPSTLLRLDGRIGHLKRNDKSIFDKNFSGWIGDATISWRPRRTVELTARAGRQLQSDGYLYSDSVRQNFVSALARLAVAKHLKADLSATFSKEHFVYDVLSPAPIEPRNDRLWRLKGALSYALSKRMELRLDGYRDWRHSTNDLYLYTENAVRLSLKFTVGPQGSNSK